VEDLRNNNLTSSITRELFSPGCEHCKENKIATGYYEHLRTLTKEDIV
jgi:hypothetical protein